MWWLLLGWSVAGTATLHVGVLRQAGTVNDVAADGADGLCAAALERITCPAEGPVRFRWAGSDAYELVGQAEVAPGEVGVAFVLATEASRAAEVAQLSGAVNAELVAAMFTPAPGVPAPPPSLSMIRELERLARHPDPEVRRATVDALVPLWRHTASDPFAPEAPEVLEPGLITLLANDPDPRVRRRLASRLRELRAPSVAQRDEASQALERLLNDTQAPVQRAAMATLKLAVPAGVTDAQTAWSGALERVQRPGPPGRAAANTLAFLGKALEPGPMVDPGEAMYQVLTHHPERAWGLWYAWREHLPFDATRLRTLLTGTVGLHRGLLQHFARREPEALHEVLRAWEPREPHSDRYAVALTWVIEVDRKAFLDLAPAGPPAR